MSHKQPAQAAPGTARRALRALSLPARRNIATNAYTALMAEALEGAGVQVDDVSFAKVFGGAYDIIHIHWPHGYAHGASALKCWVRSVLFVAMLRWQKLRGARLVWTVHDMEDTIGARPILQRFIMGNVNAMTDAYVFVSESSRAAALAARPAFGARPSCITVHGVYGDAYPRIDKAAARAALGVQPGAQVIGYVGDMKPYKGLMDLLEVYDGAPADAPVLLVAGAAGDARFAAETSARLTALQAAGAPLIWIDKRLDNEEMAQAMAACDLLIAPYRVSWNSGIATLAVEHERRLLCRRAAIFEELRDEVGEGWASLYDAPLTRARIEETLRAPAGAPEARAAFIARRQWPAIGRVLADFYQSLAQAR